MESDKDFFKGIFRQYAWVLVLGIVFSVGGIAFLLWFVKALFFGGDS